MAYVFDPNEKHALTARLTFAVWDYRLTIDRPLARSEGGLDWVRWLLEEFYDEVGASILLTNVGGDTLLCEDDEGEGAAWLERMVIEARLLMPDEAEL